MRILIKFGSAILNKNNKLNHKLLKNKIKEISKLQKNGNQIIIVSSGAVACGMEIEGLKKRPTEPLKLQLLSGIGQIRLMKYYKDYFKKQKVKVSQILLTHHNFSTEKEKSTLIQIINSYINQKTIPIINENDMISKEEFSSNNIFTDNDILSALIAENLRIDLCILLTDVEGLYDYNKKPKPKLIEKVEKIDSNIKKIASKKSNGIGKGGMYSKVIAAERMTKKRVTVIIANGKYKLKDILSNKVKRTLFVKR